MRRMAETAIHELGHVLGLASDDIMYYWDRDTASPRTERPIQFEKNFECITGERREEIAPPPDLLREGRTDGGARYFEVVTPTVARVAKNHFGCERAKGARLENQPSGGDCFGDHWEERVLWNEIMSAQAKIPSIPEFLSPFTLALLEDSGW